MASRMDNNLNLHGYTVGKEIRWRLERAMIDGNHGSDTELKADVLVFAITCSGVSIDAVKAAIKRYEEAEFQTNLRNALATV